MIRRVKTWWANLFVKPGYRIFSGRDSVFGDEYANDWFVVYDSGRYARYGCLAAAREFAAR